MINAILDLRVLCVKRDIFSVCKSVLCIPLALSTSEFELYIVDCVRRTILAVGFFLCDELFSECIIVCVVADFVYHDFFLVIGDLVDDVFGTAATELQFVELGDAVRVDRETVYRAY